MCLPPLCGMFCHIIYTYIQPSFWFWTVPFFSPSLALFSGFSPFLHIYFHSTTNGWNLAFFTTWNSVWMPWICKVIKWNKQHTNKCECIYNRRLMFFDVIWECLFMDIYKHFRENILMHTKVAHFLHSFTIKYYSTLNIIQL